MMADVKWIKIRTDVFDDEKILMIESLPSSDSILIIWFKLLCFAGKMNNDGVFLMNEKVAYTEEMLAAVFRRDLQTVKMAIKVFEQYGMIEYVDNVITIPNWGKHQTLDAYEKKKERDRLYQMGRRAKQKLIIEKSSDTSSDMSVDCHTTQSSDVAVSDKDIDIDKEKDKDIYIKDICPTDKPQKQKKPTKHKYGEYSNVLLTDVELDKLKDKFTDWEDRIERLSIYIESKGAKYKSHYATILNWARREGSTTNGRGRAVKVNNTLRNDMNDLDDLF